MNRKIKLYVYIFASLLIAALLSTIPLPKALQWIWPQWMVLVLFFWILSLPNYVSFGLAFSIGLLMDALSGSMLGEHGAALIIPVYFIVKFNNKIIFNKVIGQALIVFLLVLTYQATIYWIQGIIRNASAAPTYWFSSISSAFIWSSIAALLEKYVYPYRAKI